MKRFLAPLVILFLSIGTVANADLVLTIGSPADIGSANDLPVGPFTGGDPVSIPVFAHFEAPIENPLTSYSLTIDFGGDGFGIAPFFSAPDFTSNVGGTLVADDALGGLLPIDYTISWLGSATLSNDLTTPTAIFSIDFDTAPNTPSGVYDINFGFDDGSNALTAFTANGSNFNFENVVRDNGQFRITAIPEPSTLITFLLGAGGFMAWSRNKK